MSSGCMYSKRSGMPRTTSRLSRNKALYLVVNLDFCTRSITKMMSAHSIKSPLSGVSASLLVPAPIASIPEYVQNTASAVGLRRRFLLHTKRKFTDYWLVALSTFQHLGNDVDKASRTKRKEIAKGAKRTLGRIALIPTTCSAAAFNRSAHADRVAHPAPLDTSSNRRSAAE